MLLTSLSYLKLGWSKVLLLFPNVLCLSQVSLFNYRNCSTVIYSLFWVSWLINFGNAKGRTRYSLLFFYSDDRRTWATTFEGTWSSHFLSCLVGHLLCWEFGRMLLFGNLEFVFDGIILVHYYLFSSNNWDL